MRVLLTYFKLNGKYYGDGAYDTADDPKPQFATFKPLYWIWEEVAEKARKRRLPGLEASRGYSDFIILVNVPDHPHQHPHLIQPAVYSD